MSLLLEPNIYIAVTQHCVGFLQISMMVLLKALHLFFFLAFNRDTISVSRGEIEQNVHQKALILLTLALIWAPV